MSFLVKHLVDSKGIKRGTLYAGAHDREPHGSFMVGWAMCNKTDVFAKRAGVKLARDRASTYDNEGRTPKDLPKFILDAMPGFLARCTKYFQGKQAPGWCQPVE